MDNINYVPAVKAGKSYNAAHRDRGFVVHAVEPMPETHTGYWGNKAFCGTEPGITSYGWDNTDKAVNCPRCLKRLEKLRKQNNGINTPRRGK